MTKKLGDVIWASVKPIIKIYLIIGVGFFMSKVGLITAASTKSISSIILTVLLPCLAFNKIVANIEDNDIKNVGIICLSAVMIFATGLFFAFVVSRILPVPKRWRGGMLAGGMFPNISDLPIAYLQTLDQGFIFTPEEGEKGVANVIIFLAMFLIFVFNLGGFRLIEMDFDYKDEESEVKEQEESLSSATRLESRNFTEDDLYEAMRAESTINHSNGTEASIVSPKTKEGLEMLPSSQSPHLSDDDSSSLAHTSTLSNHTNMEVPVKTQSQPVAYLSDTSSSLQEIRRRKRRPSVTASQMSELIRTYSNVDQHGYPLHHKRSNSVASVADSIQSYSSFDKIKTSNLTKILTSDATVSKHDIHSSGSSLPKWMHKFPLTSLLVFFLKNCLRPCSLAVILALIFAFIPWVKALFVTTPNTPHISQAPDQQPPLSFIMDFTAYVGAASVPFGLLLLGATLGSLKIGKLYPGFWKSAVVLVVLRQCVMPIFGVLWCDRLVKAGWVNWDDDALLLFVIAINWGLPTMTTLIYFTASFTPPDEVDPIQMECTSFFLMIQYPLLVVSLPFLVTYFLKVQLKL